MRLPLLDTSPHYSLAHPLEHSEPDDKCDKCALAVRPDTGEIVLLWLCGEINWSVSREDPEHERHGKEIEAMSLC